MQELLQQENAVLATEGLPGTRPAGNRNLSSRHLRTVSFHWRLGHLTPIKVEMKNEFMKISAIFATLALVALTAVNASAQTAAQPATNGPAANSVDTERIIRTFTTKE